MRISDQERREVAAKLRNGGIARDSEEAYTLLLSCVGIGHSFLPRTPMRTRWRA